VIGDVLVMTDTFEKSVSCPVGLYLDSARSLPSVSEGSRRFGCNSVLVIRIIIVRKVLNTIIRQLPSTEC
jgi:hypothetical protein